MERLSYFDLHADTLTTLLRSDGTLERNALQASISGGRCFESYSQVWAIFTEPGAPESSPLAQRALSYPSERHA